MNTARDMFYFVDDVMQLLGLSKSKSYKIIRELNLELQGQGVYTIDGRVNRRYFDQRFGLADKGAEPKRRSRATA